MDGPEMVNEKGQRAGQRGEQCSWIIQDESWPGQGRPGEAG